MGKGGGGRWRGQGSGISRRKGIGVVALQQGEEEPISTTWSGGTLLYPSKTFHAGVISS